MSVNLKSRFKKNVQKGFTLIELVLVLAIVAALSMLVFTSFNTSNDTNKVNTEVNNINSLSGAIRNMFNTQGNYTGLTNDVILRSISFPESMRVTGAANNLIKNGWVNTGYTVAPATVTSTDDVFRITMLSVPQEACASISSVTYRHFITLTANNTAVTNVATATTACNSDSNTLIFTGR